MQSDPETIRAIEARLAGFAEMSEHGRIDGAALLDFSKGRSDLPSTTTKLGLRGSRGMTLVFELLERAGLERPAVAWGEAQAPLLPKCRAKWMVWLFH
ncbi:hypothetical protein [Azospirillum sp. TSO5]|uniref:hypothetical protein n=1 Tax=Azospirillum sp. TSO5 TaxID=716760 RepID=UPI000D60F01C|nr:hypothetical protein [Azospirillum sp. TSO5]PWC98034.1 hypothetical protein TSO5_03245 [Azospirillum sp. TSO5]